MKHAHQILIKPLITEKSMAARETNNQFAFEVNPGANKFEIKAAVEKVFEVKVLDVTTININGKVKRRGRMLGKRADRKKAIVRLAPGSSIKYFEGA